MFPGGNRNDRHWESRTVRLSNPPINGSHSNYASFPRSNGQQSQSTISDCSSYSGHTRHQISTLSEPCLDRNSRYYRSRENRQYDGQHFDYRSRNRGEYSRGLHGDDRRGESDSFRKRNTFYHERDPDKKKKRFSEIDKRNAEREREEREKEEKRKRLEEEQEDEMIAFGSNHRPFHDQSDSSDDEDPVCFIF